MDLSTKLKTAILDDDLELVNQCLTAGVNINDTTGNPPLIIACKLNRIEIVSLLIQNGANINIADLYGFRPLTLAIIQRNLALVSILLRLGAETNIVDEMGRNMFMYACTSLDKQILTEFLKYHRDVNQVDKLNMTVIHHLAMNIISPEEKIIEIVKILIDHGAKLDILDCTHNSALFWACRTNKYQLIKLLVQHGANINSNTELEFSFLAQAVLDNNYKLAEVLLSLGADPNIKYITSEGLKIDLIQMTFNKNLQRLIRKYTALIKLQKRVLIQLYRKGRYFYSRKLMMPNFDPIFDREYWIKICLSLARPETSTLLPAFITTFGAEHDIPAYNLTEFKYEELYSLVRKILIRMNEQQLAEAYLEFSTLISKQLTKFLK